MTQTQSHFHIDDYVRIRKKDKGKKEYKFTNTCKQNILKIQVK